MLRRIASLFIVMVTAIQDGKAADPPALPQQEFQDLPKAIIDAWEKQGAKYGKSKFDEYYGYYSFRSDKEDLQSKGLPGFNFDSADDEKLKALPQPKTPFGLFISNAKITSAGVKELSRMTNLRSLTLIDCGKVGTDSLEELSALTNLQCLQISHMRVSPFEDKRMTALEKLEYLHLDFTNTNDADVV